VLVIDDFAMAPLKDGAARCVVSELIILVGMLNRAFRTFARIACIGNRFLNVKSLRFGTSEETLQMRLVVMRAG
jgi:hypothetical protein